MSQIRIELSKAIMKRKCHKCKTVIQPNTVHIRTTEWIPNNYPKLTQYCKKCSYKFLEKFAKGLKKDAENVQNLSIKLQANVVNGADLPPFTPVIL